MNPLAPIVLYLLEAIAINYVDQVSEQSCQIYLLDYVGNPNADIGKMPNIECYASCMLNNTGFIDDNNQLILSKIKRTEKAARTFHLIKTSAEDCLEKGSQMKTCDNYNEFLKCWLS
ncbi:hypothetical protein O3M35_000364 [Rhynocoris fuscipes]|uniref:Uncharacterized protein n=1 Tax=Rhynocoris fuscipes TaxID=488301 RepID=A0AAW1DNF4_9HEMI